MKSKILTLLALGAMLISSSACKEDEPITPEGGGAQGGFVIEEQYLNHTLTKASKTIEIQIKTEIPKSKWYIEPEVGANWLTVNPPVGPNNGVGTVNIQVSENLSGEKRTATIKISTATTNGYTIKITQYADSEDPIPEDIAVKPIGASATNSQPGSGIELSYDDDVNTMFHSRWNPTGPFPFELIYRFQGQESIDYIEYVPRSDGHNGCFKELEIFYAEDANRSNFVPVEKSAGETLFDFRGSALPSRVNLPAGVKPTAVKFSVKSGNGDYVSCNEMRFFRINPDKTVENQLLEVFTDITCSELKPGVTEEDIQKLSPSFQMFADAMLNGTYTEFEKSFRVHEYQAYSDPVEWAEKLMTKKYSTWDNPMGIAVKGGEKVLILVGETYGNNLQVQILGEQQGTNKDGQSYLTTQRQGHFVSLRQGVNMITPDQDGQLFLMYTALPSAPTSKPIKVHIPMGYGELAGYFDLEEHKTDEKYTEILQKTKHKYFCIKGKRMVLYFTRKVLPKEIVDPITQWDNIITWQQNFMGIEDVRPAQWNNHIAGISLPDAEGGYMWASDWTMGFTESAVSKIMGLANLNANADNAWGPAHEMGHVNQAAINWASTTESSNNLFSNYVIYRFGRYSSRGKGLYYRFTSVYEKDHSWASMNSQGTHTGPGVPKEGNGEDTYMGEDTEIHMRLNWQLWNYYHRVRKDETFFGRVFAKMRAVGLNDTENCGKKQLEFAVACSEAAEEDLTDFFEAWGFFKPHTSKISQYGTYDYVVTQPMIDDAKARMAQYPKPQHALEYIEDRSMRIGPTPGDTYYDMIGDLGYYTTYEQNSKVASNASATVSGRQVTTKNCENAVALEIRVKKGADDYGEIRYASNYVNFEVPSRVNVSGCGVFAVQADGTRIFLANM